MRGIGSLQVMDANELQGWAERASFGGLLVRWPSQTAILRCRGNSPEYIFD